MYKTSYNHILEFLDCFWPVLVVIDFIASILGSCVYSESQKEAWNMYYDDVKKWYQTYPELRPMITEALGEDGYLTNWEYDDIRREVRAIDNKEYKDNLFRDLKKRGMLEEHAEPPTQPKTIEVTQPKTIEVIPSNPPRDSSRVLEVQ